MRTMNISLPESLKDFVDEQVAARGLGTSSEYVRQLIRRDLDRQHLRGLLLQGAESLPDGVADDAYFDGLREQVRNESTARPSNRSFSAQSPKAMSRTHWITTWPRRGIRSL